jgi:hypothetical protein
MNPIVCPEYKLHASILISKVSSSVSRLFVSARLSRWHFMFLIFSYFLKVHHCLHQQ